MNQMPINRRYSLQATFKDTSKSNSAGVDSKFCSICQEMFCGYDTVFKSCWKWCFRCKSITTCKNAYKFILDCPSVYDIKNITVFSLFSTSQLMLISLNWLPTVDIHKTLKVLQKSPQFNTSYNIHNSVLLCWSYSVKWHGKTYLKTFTVCCHLLLYLDKVTAAAKKLNFSTAYGNTCMMHLQLITFICYTNCLLQLPIHILSA